jgi:MOSC domain-containing protein
MKTIARISVTPIRGFRFEHPLEVELTERGVVENRRFYLVDGDGNRLRSSLTAWPIAVEGRYDAARERLWMSLPDGSEVEGSALGNGPEVAGVFDGGRVVPARVVEGEWTELLSALAGHQVRVARPEHPGECFAEPVTLLSDGSLARLSQEAGTEVDERRFRMLFLLAGCDEHEEDGWAGRLVRVGEARVRVCGPVDRCAATTRHPQTGERDLDTLRLIRSYRGVRDGEAIDFGVSASVEQPGRVRVGDAIAVID